MEGLGRFGVWVVGIDINDPHLPRFWRQEDHFDHLCVVTHTVLERQCLNAQVDGFTPISERIHALLDGRPCAEIDIRNSQPFCLAALYSPGSIEGPGFVELVTAGKFYEQINEASGRPFSREDRDQLKEAVFSQILFGRHFTSSPLWKGFTDLFPELARIITARKSADYRNLAIDLQRKEADLMIRRVVPRLADELPGVPMLTVHDSLCIDIEYQEQAADVIRQVREGADRKRTIAAAHTSCMPADCTRNFRLNLNKCFPCTYTRHHRRCNVSNRKPGSPVAGSFARPTRLSRPTNSTSSFAGS
jgi:hypothetical protein